MDRIIDFIAEKQTIYEIYRACRLCGAGAGYKMPIIQTVVDLDGNGMELRQKILECVQIEVHQDDKMPPLICELCVDKVNDFYDFLELCKQTNKRTRMRLGLPLQTPAKDTSATENSDCILGVTEPLSRNEDSNDSDKPLSKKVKQKIVKIKKEPDVEEKVENNHTRESRFNKNVVKSSQSNASRTTRHSKRSPTPSPPRVRNSRSTTANQEDNMALSCLKEQTKKAAPKENKSPKECKPAPKSILKKEIKVEEENLISPRSKRTRDKEPAKPDVPPKKVKIVAESPKSSKVSKLRRSPPATTPAPIPAPAPQYTCPLCGVEFRNSQGKSSHMKTHLVTFTDVTLACNPCGAWFSTTDSVRSHHRRHKIRGLPYKCRHCDSKYKTLADYDKHIANNRCISWKVEPDWKCERCGQMFLTEVLGRAHQNNCTLVACTCGRTYSSRKNLKRHQLSCNDNKKKDAPIVDPEVRKRLKPVQVRLARCDSLLQNVKEEHYDVSSVSMDYGLDKNCVYPYITTYRSLRIKSEPLKLDHMVAIEPEVQNEFCSQEFVHWDSDDSSTNDTKEIDSLSTLSLKTIFSAKLLGKVPRKRRRFKMGTFGVASDVINDSEFNDFDNGNSSDSVSIFDSLNNSGMNFDSIDKALINNGKSDNSDVNTNNGSGDNDLQVNKSSNNNDDLESKDLPVDVSSDNDMLKNNVMPVNISSDNNDVSENNDVTEINNSTESIDVPCNKNGVNYGSQSIDNSIEEITNNKEVDSISDNGKSNANEYSNDSSANVQESSCNKNNLGESNIMNNEKDTNHGSGDNDSLTHSYNESNVNEHINNLSEHENGYNDNVSDLDDNTKTDNEYMTVKETNNSNMTSEINSISDINNETNSNNEDINNDISHINDSNANNESYSNDLTENNDNFNSNKEVVNGASEKQTTNKSYDISDTELEDRKLMDALDEQLGEGNYCSNDKSNAIAVNDNDVIKNNDFAAINDSVTANNDNSNANNESVENANDNNDTLMKESIEEMISDKDKITLEDLLPKNDLKSLELDNISDEEFNFDV